MLIDHENYTITEGTNDDGSVYITLTANKGPIFNKLLSFIEDDLGEEEIENIIFYSPLGLSTQFSYKFQVTEIGTELNDEGEFVSISLFFDFIHPEQSNMNDLRELAKVLDEDLFENI